MKRKKKSNIRKVEEELWELCRQITFRRHGNKCFTCGAPGLSGGNLQCGHGPWPKGALGAFLKYDLRVLRPQCMICNIRRSGMSYEFSKKLLAIEGQEYVDQLEKDRVLDRQATLKSSDHYPVLVAEYKAILASLN